MEQNTLVGLLRHVKEVLNKYHIEFWLDCGTLLGAVRNGKFIPWEHDIDLGAWQEKVSDNAKILLHKEFSKCGFDVGIYENHINIRKKGVEEMWLDINFYYLDEDKATLPRLLSINVVGKFLSYFLYVLFAPYHCKVYRVNSIMKSFIMKTLINVSRVMPFVLRKWLIQIGTVVYKKFGSKDVSWVISSDYFTNLSTIRFYKMDFNAPGKTEKYLAYRYGKNWKTSKRSWRTSRDDGAVLNPLK